MIKIFKVLEFSDGKRKLSNPLFVLAMRLQYYCIVQTVTRIGASWYQLQYGAEPTYDSSNPNIIKAIAIITQFILTPAAGIGYLLVFLRIQPEAWSVFLILCRHWYICCCCQSRLQDFKKGEVVMNAFNMGMGNSSSYESNGTPGHDQSIDTESTLLVSYTDMDEERLAEEIDKLYGNELDPRSSSASQGLYSD